MVTIKDRWLGLLHIGISLLILTYIIVYVFVIQGKYQKTVKSKGFVSTKVRGRTYSGSGANMRVWDAVDVVYPPLEPGGLFIATRVLRTNRQMIGTCGNPDVPCSSNKECINDPPLKYGQCVGNFCKELQWCPALDPNIEASTDVTSIYDLETIDNFVISTSAVISFSSISDTIFSTANRENKEIPWPQPNANAFRISDIVGLSKANMADVRERGGIFQVTFYWDCEVTSACAPTFIASRLDNSTALEGGGFSLSFAKHYMEGEKEYRDTTYMVGVRIFFSSDGIGRTSNAGAIILQLSSALALLSLSTIAADFMMLRLYPRTRRQLYYQAKVEQSEDFSDLKDRLDLVREDEYEQKRHKRA
eukprot:GILJ01002951.1.p1 GENE.GILJ01002951.1~~GILJ01002951.1.p1  ORF type:complete len:400 (+),score=38.55 GILJ01002951.1:116-1201(+)